MRRPPRNKKSPSPSPTKELLYPVKVKVPRQIQSAADLWLEFFQQFCDLVIDHDSTIHDQRNIERARILADSALAAFQERFPGVTPQ